jgi:hypothetical protein
MVRILDKETIYANKFAWQYTGITKRQWAQLVLIKKSNLPNVLALR